MESLIIKFNDDLEFRKKYNNVGTYEQQQQQQNVFGSFPSIEKEKIENGNFVT